VVIGIVVVVGGYFLLGSNSGVGEGDIQIMNESVVMETGGKKMAFAEFIKGGGSYKCTVHQRVEGADTTGVTYINGGMIRGEYTTQAQGMSIDTTMILRDGYTYTWSSFAPTMGYKVKVVDDGSANRSTEMSGPYSFDAEQIGDYDCEAWSGDASMFTLPSSVTFQEIGM